MGEDLVSPLNILFTDTSWGDCSYIKVPFIADDDWWECQIKGSTMTIYTSEELFDTIMVEQRLKVGL